MANSNLRYVRGLTVPKTIGTGRKLMHNNVRHTVNMPTGVNGFRAWTGVRKVPVRVVRVAALCGRRACERPRRATTSLQTMSRARMDLDTSDLDEMERELGTG